MKVQECMGVNTEKVCSDCQHRTNTVLPKDAYLIPPVSLETGKCDFYQMGEDQSDKRMNAVGANGNDGKHYEAGYFDFEFLIAVLIFLLFVALVSFCAGIAGGVLVAR